MARELETFLSDLEPVWEDPNEFDWLRKKRNISFPKFKTLSLEKKIRYNPSSQTSY